MPTLVINMIGTHDPTQPGLGEVIAILPCGVDPGVAEVAHPGWRIVKTEADLNDLSMLTMPGQYGRYRSVRLDPAALPNLVRIANPTDHPFVLG